MSVDLIWLSQIIDLAIAHGDGTHRKRLSQLAKVDCLF